MAQVDPGGEVIVLTSGSYAGATITKSVKIDVPTGVIAFSASPITVNTGASDVVVLRGLTLKALLLGTGEGIAFMSGARLFVENCVIDGWAVGIHIAAPSSNTFINGTTVRNSDSNGVVVGPATAASASVDGSRFEANGFGTDYCGLATFTGGKATVRQSVASNNAWGFCAVAGELNVADSLVANNLAAGLEVEGGTGRASNCIVTGNAFGLRTIGGLLESRGNNTVRGNGADTAGAITVISGN